MLVNLTFYGMQQYVRTDGNLISVSFLDKFENCPVIDQNAFSEIGPDLPVIDQNFAKFLIFFKKKIKNLGSVRAKFVYEIDRTLFGEHSQVNL